MATTVEEFAKSVDQFFLIIMGMVVLLMQCGFAFLEAGAVRSKNSTNILIKNLMDSFVAGLAYWFVGYPFGFGKGNSFIGYSDFASAYMPEDQFAFFFFQYVFAATAATIVSGAMAERCEFISYFIYSFALTAFIYPVVTHWAWSDVGWLKVGSTYENGTITAGYQDFAGSGVVHIVGGTAGFCGAIILGPRIGRFHKDTNSTVDLRGHSVPFAALGGFILVFGFLAFNGGSELGISGPGSAEAVSRSVVNTIISGSAAAFTTLLLNKIPKIGNKKWSLLLTINGALTGMVAICGGCNVYHPWSACIIGIIAALAYKMWSTIMVVLKIDDPLDAVAVHLGGGSWGVIAVAFLNKQTGIVFAADRASGYGLAWQLVGIAAIVAWTGGLCCVMFGVLRAIGILRVPRELEMKGLDIPRHGEPAYPMEAYGHGWIEKIRHILESGELHLVDLKDTGAIDKSYEENETDNYPSIPVKSNNGSVHSANDTSVTKM